MEPSSHMNDADSELVGRCLTAAVDGPFFPDWEFTTLFGLSREEARSVARAWPDVDLSNPQVWRTVHNVLNNLLGYPHGEIEAVERVVGAPHDELSALFQRWLVLAREVEHSQ